MNYEILDNLAQLTVCITGLLSICFVTSKCRRERYVGSWIGLCGQPAWFITTTINGQWLIFILSLVYTWRWYRGIKNNGGNES